MSKYLKTHTSTKVTPQSKPIPGTKQVANSAGGYVYEVDCWTRLNRFLIMGSEGGSYYVSEDDLTVQNVDAVRECLAEDGLRTVAIICAVSKDGRAPKNDPAILALAMAASVTDDATRKAALEAIPVVCRIGTHLFTFVSYVENFRGLGRGLRKASGQWYTDDHFEHKTRDAEGNVVEGNHATQLAYQVVKYQNRIGYTHDDLLRLAHVGAHHHAQTDDPDVLRVLEWITKPEGGSRKLNNMEIRPALPDIIVGYEKAMKAKTPREVAKIVSEYGLTREMVPTETLKDVNVLDALLQTMPIGAMVRNIASMTRHGLLTPTSQATRLVIDRLHDEQRIQKSRIHPISLLLALKTYESGVSIRGNSVWTALPAIVDALDDAFYLSFGNVPATGKSRCIALDVSGSMSMHRIHDYPNLTVREAAAAMAMVSMKTGDAYEVVAFTSAEGNYGYRKIPQVMSGLSVLSLSPRQRLDDIQRTVHNLNFGGTDCSLPMLYAIQARRHFDIFEVYTDNETWAGHIHPAQALAKYRDASGVNAKLVVVGMVSNGFTIADPNDPGMLDVCGFDTSTPNIISAFAEGGF